MEIRTLKAQMNPHFIFNALNTELFYRCHNSHIVNLQKVQKFVNHMGYFALMSVSGFAKGVYVVRMESGTQISTSKFIVD